MVPINNTPGIEMQTGSQQPCRGGFPVSTLKIGKIWDRFKIDKEAQIHSDVWANSDGLQKFCTPPKGCLLTQKREKKIQKKMERRIQNPIKHPEFAPCKHSEKLRLKCLTRLCIIRGDWGQNFGGSRLIAGLESAIAARISCCNSNQLQLES